ncbi:chlororespiratory reduction protein 7 [Chrysosporum bergii ANA360D]|uniref:Chlororespiratory reduction protein 7 n=1 Tax=Chrysosporum bergii ANA360D TaxID=617107 RepID=A0AA43KAN3_9CYAN|nr:chlororespiratory reduction protein 7 [Chrysosporum bergii]MDH6059696.1 chlororespiratory reduction protein 7 [Chrysosporum bergii ANA360D]
MPDSLMYQQENFVLLETNAPEQILTADELLYKLKIVLEKINNQDLPIDLQNLDSVDTQAQYLIDTSCELDIGPGKYLQWYAIRLEK